MTTHVLDWLAAYHDGELTPSRQRQVDEHLQDCPTCRAELEAIQGLSSLLKADHAPLLTPPQRFAAQVALRLPRSSPPHPRRRADQLPRWVLSAPLSLIVAWAFFQSALWLASFVLSANWILGFTDWIASTSLLETIGSLQLLNIILLVGATVLWATWLAFWWTWKKNLTLSSNHTKGGVI